MRIGGRIVVDLRLDDDYAENTEINTRAIQRKLWDALTLLPDGADVALIVDPHQSPYSFYFDQVRANANRAGSITIWCSEPRTIAHWCTALRVAILGEEAA